MITQIQEEMPVNKKVVCAALTACLCSLALFPAKAAAEEDLDKLTRLYEEYEEHFAAIERVEDIEKCGYSAIEDHIFPVVFESFGEEEVTFIPIIEDTYHRMAVLIADSEGNVLFKTNQLETNYKWQGRLEQPNKGLASVGFRDLNGDGLKEIILITNCQNESGNYADRTYKVGDVLFQQEGGFYRDWRVSDKINRFSMNKNIRFIASYVRDGNSTEALYTATTQAELVENGFQIFQTQHYYRSFEKQGGLWVVPGIIRIEEYNIFMIYLVNDQGYIVWSFQPMQDYDNLYALKGMRCTDLDGDGMKDILVLARYSYAGPENELIVDTRCNIYYQRTDGFVKDTEFEETYRCKENDTVSGLVTIIREYWGWTTEE